MPIIQSPNASIRLVAAMAAAILGVAACSNSATPKPPVGIADREPRFVGPIIDISTPDRALRTYWALEDSSQSLEASFKVRHDSAASVKSAGEASARVRSGDARRDFD